jgi:hypothetical protein
MVERKFKICLRAPLGNRSGTMLLCEEDGRVDGWLNIMNKRNRFSGILSDGKNLTISGVIRTLVSTLHYTAAGMIRDQSIFLNLKTDSGAYYPLSGKEYHIDDKIL